MDFIVKQIAHKTSKTNSKRVEPIYESINDYFTERCCKPTSRNLQMRELPV
jgi:hypothetical protein